MYSAETKNIDTAKEERDVPSFDEACTVFFNWKDSVAESAEEYSSRIRRLKLISTFKKVIDRELTKEQREILCLKYLDGKNGEEIAGMYGVSRSKICKDLAKITRILENEMRYVFEYADLDLRMEELPTYVASAVAQMTRHAAKTQTVGERLKKVRCRKQLAVSTVAESTGVPQSKIEAFEKSGKISLDSFVSLITFYSVDANQAIFGT